MKMLTIGELADQVDSEVDDTDRARWKTVLRKDFVCWAKKNKRKENDQQAMKEWKSELAKSALLIKCRI